MDRQVCPNCDSYDTERVHVEWFTDKVVEIRVCNSCSTQFDTTFGNPMKSSDEFTKETEDEE